MTQQQTGVNMRKKDPTTKNLRSGFSTQVQSTHATEPAIGWGTSVRDASLKVWIIVGVVRGAMFIGG